MEDTKDTKALNAAFDQFLEDIRSRQDLTLRQHYWLAFEAGAKHMLERLGDLTQRIYPSDATVK